MIALTAVLAAGAALAGDRMDLEKLPKSCKTLHQLQEKCRLDGCDVRKIEEWRQRCKVDSTKQEPN